MDKTLINKNRKNYFIVKPCQHGPKMGKYWQKVHSKASINWCILKHMLHHVLKENYDVFVLITLVFCRNLPG